MDSLRHRQIAALLSCSALASCGAPYPSQRSHRTIWAQREEAFDLGHLQSIRDILIVSLQSAPDNASQLEIVAVERRRGQPPKALEVEGTMLLQLKDDEDATLVSRPFNVPQRADDAPPSPADANASTVGGRPTNFAIVIPDDDRATRLIVLGEDGETLVGRDLSAVIDNSHEPSPSTGSVAGTRLIGQGSPGMQLTRVDGVLDITFIGDLFGADGMLRFHDDASIFATHLLTYEPFASRAGQVQFHYVDNATSLGCTYSGRSILCDTAKATSLVAGSGVPYDKVVIIVNNSTYGGYAYRGGVATAFNGRPGGNWEGKNVFVHEFGHSFGFLNDEYNVFSTPGTITNSVNSNCYAGAPPASDWKDLVALSEYALGCRYPNWYRSLPTSVMLTLDTLKFNLVSRNLLAERLDSATTVTTLDGIPPTVSIEQPTSGATVTGDIVVSGVTNDNVEVTSVTLYLDGKAISSSSAVRYTFSWNASAVTNGAHTLTVRARDAAGNVGSASVSVNVTGGTTRKCKGARCS